MSILILFTCGKLTSPRWSQFLLTTSQLTTFKWLVISLIVHASITAWNCPIILRNITSTGDVSKVATVPFIALTWLFRISPCTLRSVIDEGSGIVGWGERGGGGGSKTNSRGERGCNSREGWKKLKILIAGARVGF